METLSNYQRYAKRPCAICDSTKSRLLFQQHFARMSQGSFLEGYDVVICNCCGFIYADHIPSQDSFDEYYRTMSKYDYQDVCDKVTVYDSERFRNIAAAVMQHLPDTSARILDVGCSTGHLLSLFKQAGYLDTTGLDPSSDAAVIAEGQYGIRVLNTSLPELQQQRVAYDCILLSGVLEHVADLSLFLSRIRSLLASHGLVFIEVPDVARFAASLGAPFQEFSIEHINYFSQVSLSNLLRKHGFSIVFVRDDRRAQSANTVMPVVSAIYRKSEHAACVTPEPDTMSESAVKDYIAHSARIDSGIHRVIDNIVSTERPIIVWGVGTHTLRLLETSRLGSAKICAFVDSNPHYHGKKLHGRPIIDPGDLRQRKEAILISSQVFQSEIERQIRYDLHLKNDIIKMYSNV